MVLKNNDIILPEYEDIGLLNNKQINYLFDTEWTPKMASLVNKSGPAKTLMGEVARSLNHIIYHYVNDGDIIGNFQNAHNVETAFANIFFILENNLSLGETKDIGLLDTSFQDIVLEPKGFRFFKKDYLMFLKWLALRLLALMKRESMVFNSTNKYAYEELTIDDFEYAWNELAYTTKDEMLDLYQQYLDYVHKQTEGRY